MSDSRNSTLKPRLCADCERLRLDDKALGGYAETAGSERPALSFNLEEAEDCAFGELKMLLRQSRIDSSPNFATLAKSAAAGCGLCGFLRNTILHAGI
jgi:hypothetical protein